MNTQARDERSRGWSPLAKLALWAGATALLALVAQLCTLPLGAEYSIFTTGGGRSVLLALALIVLLYLMAYDQRSAAEYGLVVDRRWAWHALGGMGLGVAFYGAICVAAVGLGVFNLSLAGPSASTVATCLFAVVTAIPVAALQQIIFSGYLPSTIRQRHSVATSVMAPSLAFGLFAGMAEADGLLSYEGSSLAVGMFLIASLLCLVRLSLGNISLPAGMLAGAIVLRRVIRKLGLMAFNADHDWTLWVAPHGDPRQGPLMWAALGLCIAAAAIVLW
ncbi:MAG: hypothetical protein KDA41_14370, partial [Planctomycetales bacterium]|nr:hypothetical protein [Planctomycetales bacterium]